MNSPAAIVDKNMASKRRRSLRLALLLAYLVATQWLTVLHAVEHDLHAESDRSGHLCFVCAAADHLGNGLLTFIPAISGIYSSEVCLSGAPDSVTVEPTRPYFARAPPDLLFSLYV